MQQNIKIMEKQKDEIKEKEEVNEYIEYVAAFKVEVAEGR